METGRGIRGDMSRLYDVFVDWPGRLAREMPGLELRLREVGAKRVLDAGCGTGRHVQALVERGFDAHGADVSDDMLAQARELVGDAGRLHGWRLGSEATDELRALAPFDAVLSLGNVWPQLLGADALAAATAFRELLRPGGLVLVGLKAFAAREPTGNPYLPLMRRVHEGRTLFFVRFVDFGVAQSGPHRLADLHMAVVEGEAGREPKPLLHNATRVRVWSAAELQRLFTEAGFVDVRVSARLDDPGAAPQNEDVFVIARAPAGRA